MYQFLKFIEAITPYLAFIGMVVSILVGIKTLLSKEKPTTVQNVAQQGFIDNRSIHYTNQTIINQPTPYIKATPYKNEASTGANDSAFFLIGFVITVLLWKHIEVIHFTMILIIIASLISMLYFAKKNTYWTLPKRMQWQLYAYLLSFAFCLAGLTFMDQTLSFKLHNLEAMKESLNVFFSMLGIVLIPYAIFNPLSKEDQRFCYGQHINFCAKNFLAQITPAVFSFFLCSGILFNIFNQIGIF